MAGFTTEEREAVRAVVKQGFTTDALRLIGKLSFGGNGLMAALNLGAAGVTGGTSLIATGAASVAKSMADKITTKRANRVLQMVLAGKTPSRSTIESLTRVERRALARAIVSGVSQPTGDVVERLEALPNGIVDVSARS